MPILHKNTDRLLRDAKKIRKEIASPRLNIHLQDIMNLVSHCFGWESWNAMFVAAQGDTTKHTWWHDMRWREKVTHLSSRIPKAILRSSEPGAWGEDLSNNERSLLLDVLSSALKPKNNELNCNKKGFKHIGRWLPLRSMVEADGIYKRASRSRLREGIRLNSDDSLCAAKHLEKELLPSMNHPDCFLSCDPFYVADFVRVFSKLGYCVTVFNSSLPLPYDIKSATVHTLPRLTDNPDDQYGLRAYFNAYFALIDEGGLGLPYVSLTNRILDMVFSRSVELKDDIFNDKFMAIPTLNDIIEIAKSGKPHYKKTATSILDSICVTVDEALSWDETPAIFEERWQYSVMQFSEQIKMLRNAYRHARYDENYVYFDDLEIKPGRTLYLNVRSDYSANSRHAELAFSMFLKKRMESQSLDDMWLISPENRYFTEKMLNLEGEFNFSLFNRACMNVFVYGELELPDPALEFDTILSPVIHGTPGKDDTPSFVITDCRADILKNTIWDH
tara:strand:- start:935 stop:2443 length:1509 start_codon:yes stop_codon:yes gene_type:complete